MLVECRAVIDLREDVNRSCSELKLKLLLDTAKRYMEIHGSRAVWICIKQAP
jgi:hypothetical protein